MNYVYFKKMALKREMQLKAKKKSISGQKLGAQTEPSAILFYQETIMCNESLISGFLVQKNTPPHTSKFQATCVPKQIFI